MKKVCFTGHRPNKLFGYERCKYSTLMVYLVCLVRDLYEQGYRVFVTGGAQGFDQLMFWAIEKAKIEFDDIENAVFIPFSGQELRWSDTGAFSRHDYDLMLLRANSINILREVDRSCSREVVSALYARNHEMVNYCDTVVALYIDNVDFSVNKGGTAECLRYANKNKKEIWILNESFLHNGLMNSITIINHE